jgi:hypothetical protein
MVIVMEKAKTHLGNSQLHKQHSVMIEGGTIPRARVMDQTMIDRYLMRGIINLKQHQAGEYLLKQASTAGVWPTGVNMSASSVDGGRKNYVPFGVFPFGRTLVTVRRRYGPYHAYVVKRVVCNDWDVSANKYNLGCLKDSLNCIADNRMGWKKNPLRYIERAVKKRNEAAASPPVS